MSVKIPSLQELLEAGVHFGHRVSRWHPKTKQYIHTSRGGVHIINLEKTQEKLRETLDYVRDLTARGGTILFLGTKRQASAAIKKYAEECGAPYISSRWLGGTLTNFGAISALVKHFQDLKAKQAAGELVKYTKKEQSEFAKEIIDLEAKVGGIEGMNRVPDAVFIVDLKKEKTAVAEAISRKVPIVGLLDTNVNPDYIAHAIPSNDDAVKTIELMVRLVSEAVKEGKQAREKAAAATATASV